MANLYLVKVYLLVWMSNLPKKQGRQVDSPPGGGLETIFHFCHVFQGKACVLKGYILSPASAEKQRIAEEVASMLKLSVDIDTSSPERLVLFYSHICICKYLEEICLFLSIHYCCLKEIQICLTTTRISSCSHVLDGNFI